MTTIIHWNDCVDKRKTVLYYVGVEANMTTKQAHWRIIANHLWTRGGITSAEAFELYGITRLSARIMDLRNAGLVIECERYLTRNRYGNAVRYGVYTCKSRSMLKRLRELSS